MIHLLIPVIEYDEAIQEQASHSELTRWNLLNNKVWLETIGPCVNSWVDTSRTKAQKVVKECEAGRVADSFVIPSLPSLWVSPL